MGDRTPQNRAETRLHRRSGVKATPAEREAAQRKNGHGLDARQLFVHNKRVLFTTAFPHDKRHPVLVQTHRNVLDDKGRYIPLDATTQPKTRGAAFKVTR